MKNVVAVLACLGVLVLFAFSLALMGFHGSGGMIIQLFLWFVIMPATFIGVKSLFPNKTGSTPPAATEKAAEPKPFAGFQDLPKPPTRATAEKKLLSSGKD